ncbi:hypothetical protein GCM10018987_15240 [Streptomyces cremeus]
MAGHGGSGAGDRQRDHVPVSAARDAPAVHDMYIWVEDGGCPAAAVASRGGGTLARNRHSAEENPVFRSPIAPPLTLAATTLLAVSAVAVPAQAGDRSSGGPLPAVAARAETPVLHDDAQGGNADADDPAIWRDATAPGRSLVIATAKEGGLRVYDLDARPVQTIAAPPAAGEEDAPGRFNNVDLVAGLRLSSGRADLAVTTDRGHDRLRFLPHRPRPCGRPAHRRHGPGRSRRLLPGPGRGQ